MTFQVIEDLASETTPSDSNNSADSALRLLQVLIFPQPRGKYKLISSTNILYNRQDSSMSAESVNGSVLSESESLDGFSPYRYSLKG